MDIIWPESDNDRLHPGSRKGRHVVYPIRCGRGSPWTYPPLSSAAARLLFSARTAAGTSQPPERDLERDATNNNGCWIYMESDSEVGFTPRLFINKLTNWLANSWGGFIQIVIKKSLILLYFEMIFYQGSATALDSQEVPFHSMWHFPKWLFHLSEMKEFSIMYHLVFSSSQIFFLIDTL